MIAHLYAAAIIGALATGGPCTAARVIAGSAFYGGKNRVVALAAFTFGAFATDVALVSSLGLFFRALQYTGWLYALAAAAALVGAIWSLAPPATHGCDTSLTASRAERTPVLAYPMLAGIASALMLGACCAPFVFAAAAAVGMGAAPLAVALAYAAAHAGVPLAATLLAHRFFSAKSSRGLHVAASTVQAGLLLGCAIYFGVLA